jgi:hypothetical protein
LRKVGWRGDAEYRRRDFIEEWEYENILLRGGGGAGIIAAGSGGRAAWAKLAVMHRISA